MQHRTLRPGGMREAIRRPTWERRARRNFQSLCKCFQYQIFMLSLADPIDNVMMACPTPPRILPGAAHSAGLGAQNQQGCVTMNSSPC